MLVLDRAGGQRAVTGLRYPRTSGGPIAGGRRWRIMFAPTSWCLQAAAADGGFSTWRRSAGAERGSHGGRPRSVSPVRAVATKCLVGIHHHAGAQGRRPLAAAGAGGTLGALDGQALKMAGGETGPVLAACPPCRPSSPSGASTPPRRSGYLSADLQSRRKP
jgi:hypothetical protein